MYAYILHVFIYTHIHISVYLYIYLCIINRYISTYLSVYHYSKSWHPYNMPSIMQRIFHALVLPILPATL